MFKPINVEIAALGVALPKKAVQFGDSTRYRISESENHLSLFVASAKAALKKANLTIDDIDAIVGACAVGLQPIPCTAALIHEMLGPKQHIPAFDVNSTCTSFLTALDVVGQYIQSGRFKRVLVISGDVSSIALNENERHSFELFGDGAVSAIITSSESSAILFAHQLTYSKGAHLTEIIGGLTTLPSFKFTKEKEANYQFHMEGQRTLKMSMSFIQEMMSDIKTKSHISLDDIAMVVPHQASPALSLIMKKIGIPKARYIDIVKPYGNMVSASIPFALYKGIEDGKIKRGDLVLLIGTAAGLTINAMIIKY